MILNTTTINSIYKGTTQVNKVYFGDVLVFGGEPAPSGITTTSDGKGLIIPQGTTIKSYMEESGKYTLPVDITIPDVSNSGGFSAEGIMGDYYSQVVVTNSSTQQGKIFSGSPNTAYIEYNGNQYTSLTSNFQDYINDFNYSGAGYKQVGPSRFFPQSSSTPKGIRHVDLGAFNIHTEDTVNYTQLNTQVQIQQHNTGTTETTLKALYAVDGNGNLLKEVTNISIADGSRYLFPQISKNTKKPIHILADIDNQDTTIQIFLKAYCLDYTSTTNYDTTLYFEMNDNGRMAGNRVIDASSTPQALPEALCSFKVSSDGNIYDLTT